MKTLNRPVLVQGLAMLIAATTLVCAEAKLEIPNQLEPFPQILTGGQPTTEQLEQAAREGFRTIVTLRPSSEIDWDERALVEKLGLRWVHIPIAGADDLTIHNAELLAAAIDDPASRPAIVHCASGNRVGALFAVKAFHLDGLSAEAALAVGDKAGMTRLKAAVETMLRDTDVLAPTN